MATVTVTSTTTSSRILPFLSAFGPNVSNTWDTLVLKISQASVSAFITGYRFETYPTILPSEDPLFIIPATSVVLLSAVPVLLTSTGFTLPISATIATTLQGQYNALITLTLSAQALTGAAVNTPVDTTTQTVTLSLTAVNLASGTHPSADRRRRLYVGGYI